MAKPLICELRSAGHYASKISAGRDSLRESQGKPQRSLRRSHRRLQHLKRKARPCDFTQRVQIRGLGCRPNNPMFIRPVEEGLWLYETRRCLCESCVIQLLLRVPCSSCCHIPCILYVSTRSLSVFLRLRLSQAQIYLCNSSCTPIPTP